MRLQITAPQHQQLLAEVWASPPAKVVLAEKTPQLPPRKIATLDPPVLSLGRVSGSLATCQRQSLATSLRAPRDLVGPAKLIPQRHWPRLDRLSGSPTQSHIAASPKPCRFEPHRPPADESSLAGLMKRWSHRLSGDVSASKIRPRFAMSFSLQTRRYLLPHSAHRFYQFIYDGTMHEQSQGVANQSSYSVTTYLDR